MRRLHPDARAAVAGDRDRRVRHADQAAAGLRGRHRRHRPAGSQLRRPPHPGHPAPLGVGRRQHPGQHEPADLAAHARPRRVDEHPQRARRGRDPRSPQGSFHRPARSRPAGRVPVRLLQRASGDGRRPAARGPGTPRGERHARRRLRRAPSLPGEPEPRTQLDALLAAVSQLGHPPVRQIWNELLPEHLPFTAADKMRRVPGYERAPGRLVLLGVADDPANQAQHASVVDLQSGGGLLVLGTGGSGKTTVLRTAACSAALDDQRAGGGTVALFVLDFSSGELRSLTALPQCSGSAPSTTWRRRPGSSRRSTPRSPAGGPPVTEAGAGRRDRPTVLLLVDGYTNLVDALQNTRGGQEQSSDQWLSQFHRIVADGRQSGVHSLITADRSGSVRSAIFAEHDPAPGAAADGRGRDQCPRGADHPHLPSGRRLPRRPPGAGGDPHRRRASTPTPPCGPSPGSSTSPDPTSSCRPCRPSCGGRRPRQPGDGWGGAGRHRRHLRCDGAVRPQQPRRARHRAAPLGQVVGPAVAGRAARRPRAARSTPSAPRTPGCAGSRGRRRRGARPTSRAWSAR